MEIRVFDTSEQVGQAAAVLLAAQLLRKPDSVLGLATGSSPIPAYTCLIDLNRRGVWTSPGPRPSIWTNMWAFLRTMSAAITAL